METRLKLVAPPRHHAGRGRAHVLFVDATEFFGPMMQVHSRIMRHLDPETFRVSLLANSHGESAARLKGLPNLSIWQRNLGRSTRGRGVGAKASAIVQNLLCFAGLPFAALSARRAGIDIVHAGMTPRMIIASTVLARASGAKLVLHVHENRPPTTAMKYRFLRMGLRRADAVITVSGFVKETVVGMGVDEDRVWPILNTTDLQRFRPANSGEGIRREYGIPPDAPLVVCLGRLFPGKGQHHLVRAMDLVHARMPQARALIIGWEDHGRRGKGGGYRQALEDYCRDHGLQGTVIIGDARPDAPEIMAAADIFAAPFTNDAGPLTILEAMATGKPVVAYRDGGISEQVEEGGLLVPPRDDQALAEAILALAADPARRALMGRRNRQRVEAHFYEARLAEQVEAVYRHILAMPEASRIRAAA